MTDERKGDSHIKFKMPSSLREMEGDYKDPLLPQCVITPSMSIFPDHSVINRDRLTGLFSRATNARNTTIST